MVQCVRRIVISFVTFFRGLPPPKVLVENPFMILEEQKSVPGIRKNMNNLRHNRRYWNTPYLETRSASLPARQGSNNVLKEVYPVSEYKLYW